MNDTAEAWPEGNDFRMSEISSWSLERHWKVSWYTLGSSQVTLGRQTAKKLGLKTPVEILPISTKRIDMQNPRRKYKYNLAVRTIHSETWNPHSNVDLDLFRLEIDRQYSVIENSKKVPTVPMTITNFVDTDSDFKRLYRIDLSPQKNPLSTGVTIPDLKAKVSVTTKATKTTFMKHDAIALALFIVNYAH